MKIDKEISETVLNKWKEEGYTGICYIENKGWCGFFPFLFTVGLVVGLEDYGYETRYCYPRQNAVQAIIALERWKVEDVEEDEDPTDPYWIKRKGNKEYLNSNYLD